MSAVWLRRSLGAFGSTSGRSGRASEGPADASSSPSKEQFKSRRLSAETVISARAAQQFEDRHIVAEAVDSARTLLYPLCLLPFDVLKQAGQLRSHEELRAKLVRTAVLPASDVLGGARLATHAAVPCS